MLVLLIIERWIYVARLRIGFIHPFYFMMSYISDMDLILHVLQEKHDVVVEIEKKTKLEEQLTPLSTSFMYVKVLTEGTRCMI
jgi:hypothetical protein